jgi:hypothetical protein
MMIKDEDSAGEKIRKSSERQKKWTGHREKRRRESQKREGTVMQGKR